MKDDPSYVKEFFKYMSDWSKEHPKTVIEYYSLYKKYNSYSFFGHRPTKTCPACGTPSVTYEPRNEIGVILDIEVI